MLNGPRDLGWSPDSPTSQQCDLGRTRNVPRAQFPTVSVELMAVPTPEMLWVETCEELCLLYY